MFKFVNIANEYQSYSSKSNDVWEASRDLAKYIKLLLSSDFTKVRVDVINEDYKKVYISAEAPSDFRTFCFSYEESK